jgi:hypothetical protein
MLPCLCDAYGLMVARGIHDDAWAWLSTRRTPGSDVEAYGGAATHSRGCLREWGGRFLSGDAEGQPRELLSMHEGGPEAREGDKQTGTYYMRAPNSLRKKQRKQWGFSRRFNGANFVSNVGKLINLPRD